MKKILVSLAILLTSVMTIAQKDLENGIYAQFNTTKGEILVMLEYKKVPMTVANFVALAEGNMAYGDVKIEKPFFDGLLFHRVIKDFMIQGGDPNGNGSGNPGYKFYDEIDTSLKHTGPGILSMANSGANTNGSQFFITHKETSWLDGKHAVFGHVVKGQEIVDTIEQGDIMTTVAILRIGKDAKKWDAVKTFNDKIKKIEADKADYEANKVKYFKEKWLKKYPKMKQTSSGLMYEHVKEGTGNSPKAFDEIHINYTGYLEDGTEFETSKNNANELKLMYKQIQLFKGWEEAFSLMKPGGTIRIVQPPWLGLGAQSRGKIPANAELIFDLELVGVKDLVSEFKTEMKDKYPDAKQLPSGLMYKVLDKGTGEFPQAGQKAEVHYTGKLMNGEVFDSSIPKEKTFEVTVGPMGRVIEGWKQGIPLCPVGGKIQLIIPHWLAYGKKGFPPKIGADEHLEFEVQVISIK